MKKFIKIFIIIISIFLLGGLFFIIDYSRVKNDKSPIFCINTTIYKDGGTRECIGFGYKVIEYKLLSGYKEKKIGTWQMNYKDYLEEINKYEKKQSLFMFNNTIYTKSDSIIDYMGCSSFIGSIDTLKDSNEIPKNNGETNNEEILNAKVCDISESSAVIYYNNEYVLFNVYSD